MSTAQRMRAVLGLDRRAGGPHWLVPLVAAGALVTVIVATVAASTAYSSAATVVAVAFTVAGFATAARRSAGDARRSWIWFAAGALVYLAGEVTWAAEYLVAGEPADVSLADAFWLAAYPLYFVALQIRSRVPGHREMRGEGILESAIVMGVFGIVLWRAVLEPALAPEEPLGDALVAIAYPVGDLGLLWMLLRAVYGTRAAWDAERSLLAIGLLALVAGDTLWALPVSSPLVDYADLLYVASALALGGAGFAAATGAASEPRPSTRQPLLVELMPYVAGIAVAAVPVAEIANGDANLWVVVAAACVLMLVLVRLGMLVHENRLMRERAEQAALVDGLTGLYNHRFFQERLREELERGRREEGRVGLLMIDIDRFKQVNDTIGHLGGDRLLRELGAAVKKSCRPSDSACRVGGDELAVIAPGTDSEALRAVAERIAGAAAEIRLALPDASEAGFLEVTLSIGGCVFPDDAGDPTSLTRNADAALYRSKRDGRARVTMYSAELSAPAGPGEALAIAEEQARERELDFRLVFAAAHDPMLVLSAAGNILDSNPAASRFSGLSTAQLRERSIFDFVSERGAETLERIIRDEARTGHEEGDFDILMPDRSSRPVEFSVTTLPPDRHLLVLRDATRHRAAQARTEAFLSALYRVVVESIDEGVVLMDPDGRIHSGNPAAARMLGVPADRLSGLDLLTPEWDTVDREGRPLADSGRPPLSAAALSGEVFGLRRPNGRRIWLEVNAELLEPLTVADEPLVVASFVELGTTDDAERRRFKAHGRR